MSLPKLAFSGGTLILTGAPRQYVTGGAENWIWDHRVGAWRCDALHYRQFAARMERLGQPFNDRVPNGNPFAGSESTFSARDAVPI